jgi:hypothetical protein
MGSKDDKGWLGWTMNAARTQSLNTVRLRNRQTKRNLQAKGPSQQAQGHEGVM